MRRYRGRTADSARWERFQFRDDDIVISTPSKCGTTWMQHIVGMLVLDRTELGAPISQLSPWLDMLLRTDDDVFATLDAQTHRRWIKTHTPLDGVPLHAGVTYIAVVRHPLDVALSDRDHSANQDTERVRALRAVVVGDLDPAFAAKWPDPPEDAAEHLRWFIDNDLPPSGSGPNGLADFCDQASTYWARRHTPNVHLFHYADLWNDLDGEMRRVADALDVPVDEPRWPQFVEAATIDSMRARAGSTAPEAHLSIWHDPQQFFRVGGTREWAALLDESDLDHFHDRVRELAGDAAPWILTGRAAL
jgi:aryl sulfotransferase